jgi:GxxExxY protein
MLFDVACNEMMRARARSHYIFGVMNNDDTDFEDLTDGRGDAKRPDAHLLHYETTRAVIGRFYATHTELGYGFAERVYKNGLVVLLRHAGLAVDREVPFEIPFHGEIIGEYRADIIVASQVVVEVKTGRAIHSVHEGLLRNYLRVTGLRVGLLLNFGPKAEFKRIVWTPHQS